MSETQVLYGPRLGKEGKLRLGCCAVIFDEKRQRALLTRRADNGRWCVTGFIIDRNSILQAGMPIGER